MGSYEKAFSWVFLTLLLFKSSCERKDENDEGRPYEFGFVIEGEQHRHEKKDVNGIIQGEFGFVTGDGVYHVTAYATDENGSFHVLSMRNIKLSDDPGIQYKNAKPPPKPAGPQSAKLQLPAAPQQAITTERSGPVKFTTQPTVKPGCGGCGYITTTKLPPGQPFPNLPPLQKLPNTGPQNQNNQQAIIPSVPGQSPPSNQPNQPPLNINVEVIPHNTQTNYPEINIRNGGQEEQYEYVNDVDPQNRTPSSTQSSRLTELRQEVKSNIANIEDNIHNLPYRNGGGPSKLSGVTVSDGAIHVPGNPDIPVRDKYPGMTDGLPPGIGEGDIKDILYKFNYTVGFHGHYEKGLKNGAKVGGYFVNGRDGISRVVTYVADENGYRPRVKFVRLGLDSEQTPKEETEKNYGLVNFEFVWYPVS